MNARAETIEKEPDATKRFLDGAANELAAVTAAATSASERTMRLASTIAQEQGAEVPDIGVLATVVAEQLESVATECGRIMGVLARASGGGGSPAPDRSPALGDPGEISAAEPPEPGSTAEVPGPALDEPEPVLDVPEPEQVSNVSEPEPVPDEPELMPTAAEQRPREPPPPGYVEPESVSEGAKLLITQMAVAGGSREEIAGRLQRDFGINDTERVLQELFGARDEL